MKVAVTAAGGNLGSAIIRQLKESIGVENITGITRTPEKARDPGINMLKGDYNIREDFEKALQGVDTVLLVSGMDHPDKRIRQHRNVIEAARTAGVKKIVYTSIFGAEDGNSFSPVVQSNRQTEQDIRDSGMQWAIGRNGLYLEPDLEYIETYKKDGAIINCAGEGRCGYTSRTELAYAYWRMISDDSLAGNTYNLLGEAITQQELAVAINRYFHTDLEYRFIDTQAYLDDRIAELGEFLGTVIGGIYEGIRSGKFEGESHYEQVALRRHKSIDEMIREFISG